MVLMCKYTVRSKCCAHSLKSALICFFSDLLTGRGETREQERRGFIEEARAQQGQTEALSQMAP